MVTSVGLLFQKIVKRRIEDNPEIGPAYCSTLYLVGVLLVTVGLFCKTIIFSMVPLTTLATLSPQPYIYSSILEMFFLDADVTLYGVSSIFVTVGGMATALLGANILDRDYSLNDIDGLFFQLSALITTGCCIAVVLIPRLFIGSGLGEGLGFTSMIYRITCAGNKSVVTVLTHY